MKRWLVIMVISILVGQIGPVAPVLALQAREFPSPKPVVGLVGGWTKGDQGKGFVVVLNWDAGDPEYESLADPTVKATAANYLIERIPAWSGDQPYVIISGGGVHTDDFSKDGSLNLGGMYLDFAVEKDQTYTYTVRAINPWDGSESAPTSVMVPIKPKDEVCPTFKLYAGQIDKERVRFFWTAPCDANQYKLQYTHYPVKDGRTLPAIVMEKTLTDQSYLLIAGPGTYYVTLTAQYKSSEGKVTDFKKAPNEPKKKKFTINETPPSPDFGCDPPAGPILGIPGEGGNGWANGWHIPDFSPSALQYAATAPGGSFNSNLGGLVHNKYLYTPGKELLFPFYDVPPNISVGPSGVLEYGTAVTAVTPTGTDVSYQTNIGHWGRVGAGYGTTLGHVQGFKPVFVKVSGEVILRPAADGNNEVLIGGWAFPEIAFTHLRAKNAGLTNLFKDGNGRQWFSNGRILEIQPNKDNPIQYGPDDPGQRAKNETVIVKPDLIGNLYLRGRWGNGMCGQLVAPEFVGVATMDLETQTKLLTTTAAEEQVHKITIQARRVRATDEPGQSEPLANRELIIRPHPEGAGDLRSLVVDQRELGTNKLAPIRVVTNDKGQATVYVRAGFGGAKILVNDYLLFTKQPFWSEPATTVEIERIAKAGQLSSRLSGGGGGTRVTPERNQASASLQLPLSPTAALAAEPVRLTLTSNFALPNAATPIIRTLAFGKFAGESLTPDSDGVYSIPPDVFAKVNLQIEMPPAAFADYEGAERHFTLAWSWRQPDGTELSKTETLFLGSPAPIALEVTPEWPEGVDPTKPLLDPETTVPVRVKATRTLTNTDGTTTTQAVTDLDIRLRVRGWRDSLDPAPADADPSTWKSWQGLEKKYQALDGRTWTPMWYTNDLTLDQSILRPALKKLDGDLVTTDENGEARFQMVLPADVMPNPDGAPYTLYVTADDPAQGKSNVQKVELTVKPVALKSLRLRLVDPAELPTGGANLTAVQTVTLIAEELDGRGAVVGPVADASILLYASLSSVRQQNWLPDQSLGRMLLGGLTASQGAGQLTADPAVLKFAGITDSDGRATVSFAPPASLRLPGNRLSLVWLPAKPGYLAAPVATEAAACEEEVPSGVFLMDAAAGRRWWSGWAPTAQAAAEAAPCVVPAPAEASQTEEHYAVVTQLVLSGALTLHLRPTVGAESVTVTSLLTNAYGDPMDWYLAERLRLNNADPDDLVPHYVWQKSETTIDELLDPTVPLPTSPAAGELGLRQTVFLRSADLPTDLSKLQAFVRLPEILATQLGYPTTLAPTATVAVDWTKTAVAPITTVAPLPPTPATNLTLTAAFSCSSEFMDLSRCFSTAEATDWTSEEEGEGAWLELRWSEPKIINQLVIADRHERYLALVTIYNDPIPREQFLEERREWAAAGNKFAWGRGFVGFFEGRDDDMVRWLAEEAGIRNAAISFSDGTTLLTGQLPDNGKELTLVFPPKTVTWMRLTVDGTTTAFAADYRGAGVPSIGLGKFAALGWPAPVSTPSPTPSPTPTESVSPSPTPTPTPSPEPTGGVASPSLAPTPTETSSPPPSPSPSGT